MQEIILYAILTAIVGGLLYSVLGKNVGQSTDSRSGATGESKGEQKDAVDAFLDNDKVKANKTPNKNNFQPQTSYDGPAAEGLGLISAADPSFSLHDFVDGAKGAYGMILEAFAASDKETLEQLLNDEVKDKYFTAIDELAAKGLTQTTDLARLMSADVVGASKSGKKGEIRVAYVAEVATALKDKDGNIVQGDMDVLSRVREIWSFERVLAAKDPNWKLSGVEPHTSDDGDSGGPDHSPDT